MTDRTSRLLSHFVEGVGASDRIALLFTTNPGLESIVAEEFSSLLASSGIDAPRVELRPLGFHGHVLAITPAADEEKVWEAALRMRSVHHAIQPLYSFGLKPAAAASSSLAPPPEGGSCAAADTPNESGLEGALGIIYRELFDRGVTALESAATFRVTTKRNGEHAFTSVDVQRRAGAALVSRYGCGVDLTRYECNVRVDVFDDTCIVGLQRTRASLSRRHPRIYNPRAALKANVAYALLHMAKLGEEVGALLDPFCGSGTILLEAAALHPQLGIQGSDFAEAAVSGCRSNIAAENQTDRISVRHCDARFMAEVYPASSFRAIVTNPPFGVRLGRGMDFLSFYTRFFDQAARVLEPGGRLVLLAWKRGVVDKANRASAKRFRRLHVRVVETGGVYPRIYVFQRR